MGFVNLLINIFNYIGIIAFAASGAFKAYEKNMDVLGGIVLGSSVALAGGIIRDVLIGIFPPTNIVYIPYPATAIIASLIAYVFYPCISRYKNALMYADAVGLGTFSAVGAEIAVEHGLNVLGVILMAAVTAAGGGVIRDVLAGEVPTIFRRDIYATVAMLGGVIYLVFKSLLGSETAVLATAVIIIITRFVIIMKGLDKAYVTIRLSTRNPSESMRSTEQRGVNPRSR
ncbi:trimeric intracellular cation channel family protein [Vulcanisaeta sp. JCM 16159]|uniref:trimeric intracellular cation channel family protein n=1 Tax=Vulcanisaeta sp. JCM 16159 TaxID=1295371 RepID=UPI0006D20710|nr:trimeric intracellular cation channel family protein [Vulcanisaeta sp. JCM 16159]